MGHRTCDRMGNGNLDSSSGSGAKRYRILSAEEWSRIRDHLEEISKTEMEKETAFENELGKGKKPSKSTADIHSSFKAVKETSKEKCHKSELVKIGNVNSRKKQRKMEVNREKIIERAKTLLFENKDYARQLLSALRLSAILHERNKQIEFDSRLKSLKQIKRREMIAKSEKEAEIIMEELKDKRLCEKRKKEKFRKDLDKQIMEKVEERNLRELEIGREKAHLKKVEEELRMLEDKRRSEKEARKKKLKTEIEAYLKSEEELRRQFEVKQKLMDEMDDVYKAVAAEMERERKQREKKFARTARKPTAKVDEIQAERAERTETLKNYLLAREERRRMLLNDFLDSRREEKEKLEKRERDEKLALEKSRAERCRKEEADRAWERKEKEEVLRRKKKIMSDYAKQWQEKAEERKIEDSRGFPAANYTRENAAISAYCSEVLGLVERNRRPLYPVVAAVKDVKKHFGIERKRNTSFLESKVAIGDCCRNRS